MKKNVDFLMFADCETNPFEKGVVEYKPYCWGVAVYRAKDFSFVEYRDFLKTSDFVEYIGEKNAYCYFHNGGKFDFLFLKDYFSEGEILFINSRIAELNIKNCILRDSFLYMPLPLAAYKKDDFDYNLLYDFKKNKKAILKYLKHDCFDLAEILIHFFKVFGVELTIASACLKYFVKSEKIKTKEYKTRSENFDTIFRNFYFGGRVECFRTGASRNKKVYDINSAYPFAMLKNHPWGFGFYAVFDEKEVEEAGFVICKGVSLGAFPYREKEGVCFPRDKKERVYYVTAREYFTAKKLGAFEGDFLRGYNFMQYRDFSKYVLHFYGMKENAKKKSPDYLLAKLAMNSLYGKFGQNPRLFKETRIIEYKKLLPSFEINGEIWNVVEIISSNQCIVQKQAELKPFLNVAISASITGTQRAYLFESLWKANGVCYCDTDSIICDEMKGVEIHPSKLGAWDIEAECNVFWLGGKKLYCCFDDKGKIIKYASKGARLDQEQFETLMESGCVTWENDKPTFHAKSYGRKAVDFLRREISVNCETWIKDIKKRSVE